MIARQSGLSVINKTKFRSPAINWVEVAEAVSFKLRRRKLDPTQLVFVSSAEIQKLNRTYRGKNKPTNVLSFPETRDILIAPEVVKKEAKKYGFSGASWMIKLFIHAILHLEGYGHDSGKEARKMERLEERILEELTQLL